MFTCFRCFTGNSIHIQALGSKHRRESLRKSVLTGECVDEYGKPLTHMLAQEYGHIFVFSYVFSYMLVAMCSDHEHPELPSAGHVG